MKTSKPVPEFKLSNKKTFFSKLVEDSPSNSEVCKNKITGRRWVQFLSGAEKIVKGSSYINKNGKVDIINLAKNYGYSVEEFEDIEKLPHVSNYKKEFNTVIKNKVKVDGFSFSKEKIIYINKKTDNNRRNFVIAHELAHHLLGHKGNVFFKTSDNYEEKHEKLAYHKEADMLASILLMPHFLMQDLLDRKDKELAVKFGVSDRAIKKRKKEVEWEIKELCYTPNP
jgi:hypothetical protein